MPAHHRFARNEWERRFLLARPPEAASDAQGRRIEDRYINRTTLRLRRLTEVDGPVTFKLTQKLAQGASGAFQGLITTIYLTEEEYGVFAGLPARALAKTRLSLPPFGIDVFEGELRGLVMAEAEFSSGEEAAALRLPAFVLGEVTNDRRFTGGILAKATRLELSGWLADLGIQLTGV